MSESGGDIIIKRIKKSGHAHHGGAWKIAYADFVTAMMAFFLLLWLLSSVSEEKLKALSEYFTPTLGLSGQMGIGFEGGTQISEEGINRNTKSSPALVMGAPTQGAVIKLDTGAKKLDKKDAKNFTSTEKDLYKAIHQTPEIKEFTNNVDIAQTPEGLKIQILEKENMEMFKENSDVLLPNTKQILSIIGKFIRYLPNYISIDGHTTAIGIDKSETWKLSILRAESARKFMTSAHIDKEQIYRIVGKGDQEPINAAKPNDPINKRISIILLKNSIVPFHKKSLPQK